MPAITSANVAQAIVKLVAADALPALVGNLLMGNLVNRDFEPTLATAGDTVNVAISPKLVANNIGETGQVTTQNPSLGNAQIVLNTHVEATFQIPDVTKILATPDLLKVYMNPAVIAIAEKIETDLLAAPCQLAGVLPSGLHVLIIHIAQPAAEHGHPVTVANSLFSRHGAPRPADNRRDSQPG